MPAYRDDYEAAVSRAESLESELEQQRAERSADQSHIERLEADLREKQDHIARMGEGAKGGGAPPLPSSAISVLVVGVLAIAFCQFLGPVAWVMANKELRLIDLGLADPSKRSTVVIGKVLGALATGLLALVVFLFLVMAIAN